MFRRLLDTGVAAIGILQSPTIPQLLDMTLTADGKVVGRRTYVHVTALNVASNTLKESYEEAVRIAQLIPERDFNVIRFDESDNSVALLSYPTFFEEPFPRLARSWKVDVDQKSLMLRSYEDSFNPPVLHRKELLLAPDDPRRSKYELLTSELEALGFFEDPVRIGFKLQWDKLLTGRGFRVANHQLVPIGNDESSTSDPFESIGPIEIARHLTALSRTNFSAPVQILRRFGFLDGSRTVFDYGCGKGDDVRSLVANGLTAGGWDPYYAPDRPISAAGVVNLGFVINVIEDPSERRDALQQAFALAEEVLVVSTMVATENPGKARLYGDGVLTSRSTFQKYYTQAELRQYLGASLGEQPIAVAPGIFFVFKDKQAEQRFQAGRYRSRIRIHPLARPDPPERPIRAPRTREPAPDKYERHRALLDPLWTTCLELGREPDTEEAPNIEEIERALGSLNKALRLTLPRNDRSLLDRARRQTFFALNAGS